MSPASPSEDTPPDLRRELSDLRKQLQRATAENAHLKNHTQPDGESTRSRSTAVSISRASTNESAGVSSRPPSIHLKREDSLTELSMEQYEMRIDHMDQTQLRTFIKALLSSNSLTKERTFMVAAESAFARAYSLPDSTERPVYPLSQLQGVWKNPEFPQGIDPAYLEVQNIFFFFLGKTFFLLMFLIPPEIFVARGIRANLWHGSNCILFAAEMETRPCQDECEAFLITHYVSLSSNISFAPSFLNAICFAATVNLDILAATTCYRFK
jgi:hypothetical protein